MGVSQSLLSGMGENAYLANTYRLGQHHLQWETPLISFPEPRATELAPAELDGWQHSTCTYGMPLLMVELDVKILAETKWFGLQPVGCGQPEFTLWAFFRRPGNFKGRLSR